ncbi:MAG: FAD-binding protein [Planctomycetales bacterium]|nr:FAD-binding protein [Planctomycetales bacterium]
MIVAKNLDDVCHAMISSDEVVATAGGTKTSLSAKANLSVAELSGVLQYEPSEYTFTALAGTPLAEIREMLAKNGQFLPFDPPLINSGATLGGTVAAGLSGSGRFRFGGVRDFLLGVQMVAANGRVVFGGGKVVKNAAGFDIPKLMVGSLGKFGVMTELTFKVFPQPGIYRTLKIEHDTFNQAVTNMNRLAGQPLDLTCLDLIPENNAIVIRLGGIADSVRNRIDRVRVLAKTYDERCRPEELTQDQENAYWSDVNDFNWLRSESRLVKIAISPTQLSDVEAVLAEFGDSVQRRYCVGGNLVWLGWPASIPAVKLAGVCSQLERTALQITGNWGDRAANVVRSEFENRLIAAFCE